jgi:uncharacterized protein (DUF2384 family)
MSSSILAPNQDVEAARVVTTAVIRAADRLLLPGRVLAAVIGVSEPTVSRMRSGAFQLAPGSKPFELGVLFARLYRSLDTMVGGEDALAAQWLVTPNTALQAKPLDLIQSIKGLLDVIAYLDARRARV